jgi:hypothetical protein
MFAVPGLHSGQELKAAKSLVDSDRIFDGLSEKVLSEGIFLKKLSFEKIPLKNSTNLIS